MPRPVGPTGSASEPTAAPEDKHSIPVVPSLRRWNRSDGTLSLSDNPRVWHDETLAAVAAQAAADLTAVSGHPATNATAGEPASGDLVLRVDPELKVGEGPAQDEAYRLEIGDTVIITGRSAVAVRWGVVTALQLLEQDGTWPCGVAEDWPAYPVRGFMLDVARRFVSAAYLRDIVRFMSWFKLNTFIVHLNDNEITKDTGRAWEEAQHAFRLATVHPELADLAASSGAYNRADWDALEDLASGCGVTLVPEIDAPAHSRSFIAKHPELGIDGGDSDMLDLSKPGTITFLKRLFSEFLPWFRGPAVHMGADEYRHDLPEQYRTYFNTIAAFLKDHGKQPVAWGSLATMAGDGERGIGYDSDVIICSWNNEWYGPRQAVADGFRVINTNDEMLYVVPFADYYHGSHLNGPDLWESWEPHVFPDGQSLQPNHPQLLGAVSALWNDLVLLEYDELTMHRMIEPTFGLLAQKMWGSPEPGLSYEQLMARVQSLAPWPAREIVPE